jgi:hypothetical protein
MKLEILTTICVRAGNATHVCSNASVIFGIIQTIINIVTQSVSIINIAG